MHKEQLLKNAFKSPVHRRRLGESCHIALILTVFNICADKEDNFIVTEINIFQRI